VLRATRRTAVHNLHPLILFALSRETGSARDETEFSLVIDKSRNKLTWEQSKWLFPWVYPSAL